MGYSTWCKPEIACANRQIRQEIAIHGTTYQRSQRNNFIHITAECTHAQTTRTDRSKSGVKPASAACSACQTHWGVREIRCSAEARVLASKPLTYGFHCSHRDTRLGRATKHTTRKKPKTVSVIYFPQKTYRFCDVVWHGLWQCAHTPRHESSTRRMSRVASRCPSPDASELCNVLFTVRTRILHTRHVVCPKQTTCFAKRSIKSHIMCARVRLSSMGSRCAHACTRRRGYVMNTHKHTRARAGGPHVPRLKPPRRHTAQNPVPVT